MENITLIKKNNDLILNDLTEIVFTPKFRDIIQIIKELIEKKVLLKGFTGKDTFDYFHLSICKIMSLLDIFRDSYITWIGSLELYYDFFSDWFKFKISNPKILTPMIYKLDKKKLNLLEDFMLSRFEYQFNDSNQDNITNSLNTIFTNINPIICENGNTYKLKIKGCLRRVTIRCGFMETLSFIKENSCKPKIKDQILSLRKKNLKHYKTSEYKHLILVEDSITQDYYVCKQIDLIICKSDNLISNSCIHTLV